MDPIALPSLSAWANFYVIVGSAGAALTGLQFIVITLAADTQNLGGDREVRAFATPTIVHFCAVLFISALLSAPWSSLRIAGVTLAASGAIGISYGLFILRTAASSETKYKPVFEDWLFHTILPLLAYAMLLSAGLLLPRWTPRALFVIAAATLLLLWVGIHNAWDAVTYFARRKKG